MNDLTIANAKATDLLQLAGRYSKLTRASSTEMQGPCPKCGGTDRMHVKADMFFCRQCYPLDNNKPHDAIAFLQWAEGRTFPEAVEMLTGTQLTRTPQLPAPHHTTPEAPQWNAPAAAAKLHAMQCALPSSPGADYLNSRCLWPDTWTAYGLGYNADLRAVAMPWRRGGDLWGIRYRLLDPPTKQKIVSEPGSRFGQLLFGGQAFPADISSTARAHRYLLIVEGEINAMSCWQTMRNGRMDVLSLGSESAHIPAAFLPVAAQYRTRLVWMDKEHRAREEAARMEAGAIWSEDGNGKRDANDYLRDGTLLDVLSYALREQGKAEHADALAYDLWDAANVAA